MKVLILNGNSKEENGKFDDYIERLADGLNGGGHRATVMKLRDMKINHCIGCYSCWLKTPGICALKDDGEKVLSEYINSDFVLFSSPIVMGFVSALLKGVQERMLPLVHPFLYVMEDRSQHIPRYEKYPACGLLLDKGGDYGEVSSEIIGKVFESSKSRSFAFTKSMEASPEEIVNEISNI